MSATIRVKRITNAQNHSSDGRAFDVTYIGGSDGHSYTAYSNTPGLNLVKENACICVDYKTNVSNGRTYYNCISISEGSEEQVGKDGQDGLNGQNGLSGQNGNTNGKVLEYLQSINDLLLQLVKAQTKQSSQDKQEPQMTRASVSTIHEVTVDDLPF